MRRFLSNKGSIDVDIFKREKHYTDNYDHIQYRNAE